MKSFTLAVLLSVAAIGGATTAMILNEAAEAHPHVAACDHVH